ncbi:uncharacterized protein LOC129315372 [Prosopis cineraria]|uniref:uncharacterized protein LOC129315372 n=1 Tax=Prosopis cineraria TaxID=364024 RepID=UPI00240F3EB8|nr:uncharacterized protein LOC129315372 [Prosopis cineraria]
MQQRTSSSTSPCSGEHRAINLADPPQTKRRKTDGDDTSGLPLYDPRSTDGKREVSPSRSAGKWLHAIPLILLLCLFLLWLNSFPVNVTVRDGRITVIRQIGALLPNTTHIDLTILAVSATSISSLPQKL